ncbi:MAG TPA: 1-(5-phosphoribosyl)-5-[(5-phosphoribosylamino)methylideneamino]imidazole-4-carboxamide isomerase, partial [Planctomycetota bacterium]|nr:1-(5-phosphoribosyl)-5-[(5-phosphoribosylamino)methylideneamino]imidazole-4-carboxamide isomerase [Planctomycetota bacterium]
MLVIPAVDIKGGKCVRLRQGRADEETVFGEDPVAMALHWQTEGAGYLHVVDLDGAFEGTPKNVDLVKRIVTTLEIRVDVGGGLRTEASIVEMLDAGADRVVLGTRAVESVDWVVDLAEQHPQRIAVGIDARQGMIATHGWRKTSSVTPIELVKMIGSAPLAAYIYTDVLRDGTNTGPNLSATGRFLRSTKIPVIASGGVSSLDDVRALAKLDLAGVIVGRALYDERFTLAE